MRSRSASNLANPNNVSFAEPAILDFGNRKVTVHLIGSRHDGMWDSQFIADYLKLHKVDPHLHRLFIEEGNESQSDSVTRLKSILQSDPDLVNFLSQIVKRPYSAFRANTQSANPFSDLADVWTAHGGVWTNMDLADNYDHDALALLRTSLTHLDANYFLLYRFQYILQDLEMENFGKLLKLVNPSASDTPEAPLSPREIHFDVRRQIFDLARERCMRMTLFKNIKDGDVVVTHPQHMHAILRPEVRP